MFLCEAETAIVEQFALNLIITTTPVRLLLGVNEAAIRAPSALKTEVCITAQQKAACMVGAGKLKLGQATIVRWGARTFVLNRSAVIQVQPNPAGARVIKHFESQVIAADIEVIETNHDVFGRSINAINDTRIRVAVVLVSSHCSAWVPGPPVVAEPGPSTKEDSAAVTFSEFPAKPVSFKSAKPAGSEPMVSDSKSVEEGISNVFSCRHTHIPKIVMSVVM